MVEKGQPHLLVADIPLLVSVEARLGTIARYVTRLAAVVAAAVVLGLAQVRGSIVVTIAGQVTCLVASVADFAGLRRGSGAAARRVHGLVGTVTLQVAWFATVVAGPFLVCSMFRI